VKSRVVCNVCSGRIAPDREGVSGVFYGVDPHRKACMADVITVIALF